MRKLNTSIAILSLAIAGHAFAVSNGDITFNGKIVDNTCSIVADDVNKVVTLPTVNKAALAKADDETGSTSFDIRVENCPTSGTSKPTKVAVHFEANGSTGVDPTTGNLTNAAAAANAAKNVQVRLYNYGKADGFIKVGSTGDFFAIGTDGKATTTYAGGYYATNAVEVGDVTAKVLYTLAYQ